MGAAAALILASRVEETPGKMTSFIFGLRSDRVIPPGSDAKELSFNVCVLAIVVPANHYNNSSRWKNVILQAQSDGG